MDAVSRRVLPALLLTVFAHIGACQAASTECERRLKEQHVIRVDSSAARFFVLSSEADVIDSAKLGRALQGLRSAIGTCEFQWKNDWHVSFFSTEASAGYKDEAPLISRVQSGEWAQDYLAEFTSNTRVLDLFPAVASKRRSLTIE
jgi:hypothetical protein